MAAVLLLVVDACTYYLNGITLRSNKISRQQQYIIISSYKKSIAKSATVVQTNFENFMFN